jgi:hypothetical protein
MADPRTSQNNDPLYSAGATTRRRLGEAVDKTRRVGTRIAVEALRPAATAAGATAQFVRGLSGAAPIAPAPARTAAAPARQGVDFSRPAPMANDIDFARPAPVTLAATTVRPTARDRENALQPGDPNTLTFDGVTRSLGADAKVRAQNAGTAATTQPTPARTLNPVVAEPNTYEAARAATDRAIAAQRDAARTTRADATEVLNPMSAGSELLRRLENVSTSSQFRGSPGARNDVRQALLGQLDARNVASDSGQNAANATLRGGADAEIAAAENFATRRLDADRFNVEVGQAADELTARRAMPSQLGFLRGLDGATSILRNDGTTSTLRDEAGAPLRTLDPAAGALTPKDLFDARTEEIAAIQKNEGMTAEERQAAIAAINGRPEYASLSAGGSVNSAPAGLMRVGTKDGKAVYRDAAGNLHIDD